MQDDVLLIGVDGGATKVNAWSIRVNPDDTSFSLGRFNAVKAYREIDGFDENFTPVVINRQLDEIDAGAIQPTAAEQKQGRTYTSACADVIKEIVYMSGVDKILVGIGMPGLKTEDQRGIAAMANGPRMINYAEQIENLLEYAGILLVQPISHIGSDAYYCGLGEEYDQDGQFRDVQNSYYLGGGTGAADALKLTGEIILLDEVKGWFVKTWEMKSPEDLSVEKYVASSGIQLIYASTTGTSVAALNENGIYPPQIRQRALDGEKAARETFERVSLYLAKLLYERVTSIYMGWQGLFDFVNPNRPVPSKEHNFQKVLYDSIIIGQRLGDLLRDSEGDDILWKPLFRHLSEMVCTSDCLDETAKAHYCEKDKFKENLIRISKLREAPAIGAGVDAYLSWEK